MRSERASAERWLAFALPLVLATGCSLILASPIGQRQTVPQSSARYADQSGLFPQPQTQTQTQPQRAVQTPPPQGVRPQTAQTNAGQNPQQQQPQPRWTETKMPSARSQKPAAVPLVVDRAPSQHEQYEDEFEPMIHEEHALDEHHEQHMRDPLTLAKHFMQNGNGYTLPSGGLNFNNHVSNVNIGNSKRVSYANRGDLIMPKKGSSLFKNPGGKTAYAVPRQFSADFNGHYQSAQVPAKETKQKATPEQKALKKKLLELAEKATASPEAGDHGSLLKFDSLTKQYEPVVIDPNVQLYKKKLQDAIKALSAKKLPAEKLREALAGLDDELADSQDQEPAGMESRRVEGHEHHEASNLYDGVFSADPLPHDEGLMGHEMEEDETHEAEHIEPELHEVDGALTNQMEDSPDFDAQMQNHYDDEHQDQVQFESELEPEPEPEPEYESEPSGPSEQEQNNQEEHHENESDHESDSSSEAGDLLGNHPVDEFDGIAPAVNNYEHSNLISQVREVLADRLNRVSDLLYFRPEFMNQLLQIQGDHLTPIEREFRRMILCNSDEQFCDPEPAAHFEHEIEHHQPEYLDSESEAGSGSGSDSGSDSDSDSHMHEHEHEHEHEYQHEHPDQHYESFHEEHYEPAPQYYEQRHEETQGNIPSPIPTMPLRPPASPVAHPEHYSRSSSSFFYAQNHEHQSARMNPNGLVTVTSSGPTGSSMSHAAASVSDGKGNTFVQRSVNGAAPEMAHHVQQRQTLPQANSQEVPIVATKRTQAISSNRPQEVESARVHLQPEPREPWVRRELGQKSILDYSKPSGGNQAPNLRREVKAGSCVKGSDGQCLVSQQQQQQQRQRPQQQQLQQQTAEQQLQYQQKLQQQQQQQHQRQLEQQMQQQQEQERLRQQKQRQQQLELEQKQRQQQQQQLRQRQQQMQQQLMMKQRQ